MTSTPPSSTCFAYIECDVPGEQTLAEWRRDRNATPSAERRPRRSLKLLRLRPVRWAR